MDRPACLLCGGTRASVVTDEPMDAGRVWGFLETYYYGARADRSLIQGMRYLVRHCAACDFYWQQQVLGPDGMATLYGAWLARNDPKEGPAAADRARQSVLLDHAMRMAGTVVGAAVLDYGGGWGWWAALAQSRGLQAHLVELAQDRRDHATSRGIVTWPTIEDIMASPTRFAIVNANGVLEHIADPVGTAEQLSLLLTEGGILRLGVPNCGTDRDPARFVRKGPLQPLEHINGFTQKSLAKLVNTVGLRLVRAQTPLLRRWHRSVLRGFAASVSTRVAPHSRLPLRTFDVLAQRGGARPGAVSGA